MAKEILLNKETFEKKDINCLTSNDIFTYIEKYHPEDKKLFAETILEECDNSYNHMIAKNIFLKSYFPEVTNINKISPTLEKLLSWAK